MAQKPASTKLVTKKHLAKKERERRQLRIIISITIAVLVVVLGLLVYGLVENYLIKPGQTVATVGKEVITAGEYQTKVKYARVNMINQAYSYYQYSQMFGEMGSNFLSTAQQIVSQLGSPLLIGNEVLDQMVDEILIAEEAASRNITVSSQEIDEAMQVAFDFFPDGTPVPSATPTSASTPTLSSTQLAFLKYTDTPEPTATATNTPQGWSPTEVLEVTEVETITTEVAVSTEDIGDVTPTLEPTITPTPTPYTTQGYAKAVKNYITNMNNIGFKKADLVAIFEAQLLKEKLLEAITEDLEPFENQVWARHILVGTEEEALAILEKLEAGEDWYVLAAENSIDTSNKDQGGDLGWFGSGKMAAEFETAAFELEVGETSLPVNTEFGWHIIQSLGKGEMPLSASDFTTLKETTFTTWLNDIRSARSDIVIVENWADFVPDTPEVPSQFLSALSSQ